MSIRFLSVASLTCLALAGCAADATPEAAVNEPPAASTTATDEGSISLTEVKVAADGTVTSSARMITREQQLAITAKRDANPSKNEALAPGALETAPRMHVEWGVDNACALTSLVLFDGAGATGNMICLSLASGTYGTTIPLSSVARTVTFCSPVTHACAQLPGTWSGAVRSYFDPEGARLNYSVHAFTTSSCGTPFSLTDGSFHNADACVAKATGITLFGI
jgi:hypothetical protein